MTTRASARDLVDSVLAGHAQLRERIEDELRSPEQPKVRPKRELPDPDTVLDEVTTFVTLAKDGAYMAGDRRVHHTERSKWRLTFRRLAGDALAALQADDAGPAQQAVAQMVDLACDVKSYDYFPRRKVRLDSLREGFEPSIADEVARERLRETDVRRSPSRGLRPRCASSDRFALLGTEVGAPAGLAAAPARGRDGQRDGTGAGREARTRGWVPRARGRAARRRGERLWRYPACGPLRRRPPSRD